MIDTVRKYRNNETQNTALVTRHTDTLFTVSWTEIVMGWGKKFTYSGTPEEVGAKLVAAGFTSRAED